MRKKFDRIKYQLAFVLVIALIGVIVFMVNNRHSIYDFSHLTRTVDYGDGSTFTPVSGVKSLRGTGFEEMLPVADNPTMTLFIDPVTSNIAVLDKRNNHVWHSCPPDADNDPVANYYEKDIMRSLFGFRYYNDKRRRFQKWSYMDAAENEQFTLESITDGVRIRYEVGDTSLGIDAWPKFIEIERFQTRFMSQLDDADQRILRRSYNETNTKPGFMEMPDGVRGNAVRIEQLLELLEKLNYTYEELLEDNAAADYEMEISIDKFDIQLEIMLKGDTMVVNMPLDKITTTGDDKIFYIELLKYFGAGGSKENGYLLVPSGSGGLIDFNNEKINEATYIESVYEIDPLMNVTKPEANSPVRLPILGIKKDKAAMITWVDSGAALASINADISGKINDYNIAWYTFLLRNYEMMTMAGGNDSDMTIIQQESFEGDITLNYRFLTGDDANYTGMALAYQRELVEKGELTPLAPVENMPFYVDILGAVEKRKFILGTPYKAMEPMTTYKQANEILDLLNNEGVYNVQMRWMGWFNRGINHDVAKKVNWTGKVGSKKEIQQLNERLEKDGGGLYPAVNFQMTAWTSRNIKKSYEIARSPAGFTGYYSTLSREMLRTRGPGRFDSDWSMIVNPGVLPFHVDDFIPAYNKIKVDNLALNDLGDFLSQSIYRKNSIDRENSRMIAVEQLERLKGEYGSFMVVGGNDYSLAMADHLIDIPTEVNRYYIVDHEVPFYQIVMHGYIDYAGTSINTKEVQDTQRAFLNTMATGAAPHYMWSYQPTRNMEFTAFDRFYSTHYEKWFAEAVEQYRVYNDVYKDLRTQRIIGHRILSESSSHASAVTVTEFEKGTRIYVNTTGQPHKEDGHTIPAMGYLVK